MARLYHQWASDKKLPKNPVATIRQYTDIVNENFNIGFFKLKKDQCSLCFVMKNNPRQVREDQKRVWVNHLKNKKMARNAEQKDKSDGMKDKTIAVCSFDLQKQLSCPKSESGAYCYRSKLNVLNFTCFNMIDRVGDCFLWHEGIGKRGSDEISSCLLMYILILIKKGYRIFKLFSDNCAGQNKNRNLFAMYTWLAVKHGITITHTYYEPGHTQMPADSIHARIEKSTAKKDMYEFEDWVEAIEAVKVTIPPYCVHRLDQKSIFTFKPLVKMQNWDVDLKREPIRWKKVRVVHVNGLEGNLVRVKYEYEGDFVTMSPNKRGHPVSLKTYQPPLAYTSRIPLSKNTIEDLTWLCDNMHVPLHKQGFLRGVLSAVDPVVEEDMTDVEYETDEEICTEETVKLKKTEEENVGSGDEEEVDSGHEDEDGDEADNEDGDEDEEDKEDDSEETDPVIYEE